MHIRTQVYCFVLFLAILLTSSLVQSQAGSESEAQAVASEKASPAAFYAAVSQRFDVPADQVQALVDAGLPETEIVTLYFVAQNSLRSADEILADRESGKSWSDIAKTSGLGPELFYYPLPHASRKPFTNLYAVYHQTPRDRWSWDQLRLGDAELRTLVNLRFVGDVAGERAAEALRLSGEGVDPVSIQHFLLQGQQTASLEAGGPAERAARS